MKTSVLKKSTVLVALGALMLFGQACTKSADFGNINQDPNLVKDPVPSALLTNVLTGIGNTVFDGTYYRNTSTSGMYCQYFSQTQYPEESRYSTPNYDWDIFYAGTDLTTNGHLPNANLNDLQTLINYLADPKNTATATAYGSVANQTAVARILKAYLFWSLTDQYGNLPYTGALAKNDNLAYTPQDSVYLDLFKELKGAVAQFDDGEMPTGDIMFGGVKDSWVRFANSIRVLMALRLSNVDIATATTEYQDAVKDGLVITDNSQNAEMKYPGGSFLNPFYEYNEVIQREDIGVSTVLMGVLSDNNDPRINMVGTSTVGFPYGLTRDACLTFSAANTNWARVLAEDYRTPTSPMFLITSSYIWLARAQAAALGIGTDDITTAYKKGITESWAQWGLTGDIDAYVAQPAIKLSGTPLAQIGLQEWLAYYPDGRLGWSEWRQLGYPALTPAPGLTDIPRRFNYGPNEKSYNFNNYTAASALYTVNGTANSIYARMWWDVKKP